MTDVNQKLIAFIIDGVEKQAERRAFNASMSGMMGDGGASDLKRKLAVWLDGVQFASSGKTSVFSSLVETFNKQNDPEYNEYLRLKARFEGK